MINAAELIAKVRQRKGELDRWEWWDTNVSDTIYHPDLGSSVAGISSNTASIEEAPLALTKPERKRQRKLRREAKREDERKRIQLGIIKAPPPKLSQKNVADVIGAAYILDPTKYETMAIESEQMRLKRHLEENERRKLSSSEKWEKRFSDRVSHRSNELHCVAYYGRKALSSKEQFVIDACAKKLVCTGVCLLGENDVFLIIEAGGPEILKITTLADKKLGMSLVWQGKLRSPNFKRWSIHSNPDRLGFLRAYGVDLIYAQVPV